jgi:hypothetical protein
VEIHHNTTQRTGQGKTINGKDDTTKDNNKKTKRHTKRQDEDMQEKNRTE